MEESWLDPVRINVNGNLVEITWAERDWLLKKIAGVVGYQTIVAKFYAVEVSGPVESDFCERARLRLPLESWEQGLPDGLARLLEALELSAPGRHVGTPRFEA
jgi:hypothetical protein